MPEFVTVAGLRCDAVLGHLSDYLDGAVEPETREAIEAHLRGCDVCARFGGEFTQVVRSLRGQLGVEEPAPEVSARLDQRLAGLFE